MTKNQKILQKTAFLCLVFIITLLSFITFILCKEGNKETSYKIVNNDKKSLVISEIMVNDKIIDLSNLKNYDKKTNSLIVEKKITYNIKKLEKINIKFENTKDISIYKNNKKIAYNLEENFQDMTSLKSIILNYINSSREKILYDFLIPIIILFTLNFASICIISKVLRRVKSEKIKTFDLVAFFIAIFIIYLLAYYILQYFLKIILLIIILGLISIYIIKNRKVLCNKIEYMYFILATILGITFIYILPPLNVPDEGAHYIKSFERSNITVNSKLENDKYGHTFIYLPKSVDEFYNYYNSRTLEYNTKYNEREYFGRYFDNLSINDLSKGETYYAVADASIFAYLPSIIIMSALKLFSVSPLILLLFGRAINLLIGIILIYTAIKTTPKYKNIIFLISLLPITIQSGIGINQDWLNNALFMLVLSLILKINNDKFVNNRDIIKVGLFTIFLSLCKIIYIPIIFLLWIIPKEKFKSNKSNIISKCFIPIFVIIFALVVYKIINYNPDGIQIADIGLYTIGDFIKNPLKGLTMIYNTLTSRLTLDLYRGLFDGFAWHTIWQKDLFRDIITIIFLPLIYFSSSDEENNKNNLWAFLGIAILLCGLIYAAMMFGWTKDYMDYIDGLQPRYFIPCLPLFYICLTNFFKNKNFKKSNYIYTYLSILFIYILTYITLMKGFY